MKHPIVLSCYMAVSLLALTCSVMSKSNLVEITVDASVKERCASEGGCVLVSALGLRQIKKQAEHASCIESIPDPTDNDFYVYKWGTASKEHN